MNSLIEERDERTKKRKKIKRKMDSIIGLSYHTDEVISLAVSGTLTGSTARLLDEGYCDNGFVLKKGTLEKYLNGKNESVRGWQMGENGWERTEVLNLTDDFVGTVNLGHMDFATFPILLGEWNKEDMSLVDIENDRKALDIAVRLDEESMFVKELRRQNHDIGVSAEFWYHINQTDTEELSNMLGYYMPVIDEIFIFAYGLVGECGNVNSSGLELKGETMPDELKEVIEVEETENDEIELAVEEEEIEEVEETEEVVDEVEEPVEAISEEAEVEEVEDEEDEGEEAFDEIAEEHNRLVRRVGELEAEVADLKAHIDALKKDNRRLSGKLQKEKEKRDAFFQKVSIKIEPTTETKKDNATKFATGDGIGD